MGILERTSMIVETSIHRTETKEAIDTILTDMKDKGYYPEMMTADKYYLYIIFAKAPTE